MARKKIEEIEPSLTTLEEEECEEQPSEEENELNEPEIDEKASNFNSEQPQVRPYVLTFKKSSHQLKKELAMRMSRVHL